MKKIILSLILLSGCAIASAQVNLREGIVITLGGDTLHGMIDYRTDRINAEQCVFMANGASAATTYKPGEIAGYRFLDNGRYYVSRTVPMPDSTTQTVFLEFLVRGQLSAYYLAGDETRIFYFEQEDGTLKIVKSVPIEAHLDVRRASLAEIYGTLGGSEKAQKKLLKIDMNARAVTDLVETYNDDVCPDGKCEIFKYRQKRPKQERTFHWFVSGGYTNFSLNHAAYHLIDPKRTYLGYEEDGVKSIAAFNVASGLDLYVPRLCKGLLAQLYLEYVHTSECDMETSSPAWINNNLITYKGAITFSADELSINVGPAYQLPFWKVQPRIGGGVSFVKIWDKTELPEEFEDLNTLEWTDDHVHVGYYLGAGIVYPLRKGAMTFDCKYSAYKYGNWDVAKLSFNLGYQF